MFVIWARRRLRAVPAVLLSIALLLSVIPAASLSAQTGALEQAYAYLRAIPGLKAQLPNLNVTLADAASPASWAAMGAVTLDKKLRNWFKPLVESRTGWGQLPPAGTSVWATFVSLKERPSLKGPSSIVVHQGFGDGTKVVSQGLAGDPFEVDDTVDSFGIWYRDDVGFYPQAASSSVGPSGVNWYDLQFKGAGGVTKKVMANVVPIEDPGGGNPPPGGGGGGGAGGGGNPPGGAGAGGAGNGGGGGGGDGDGAGGDPTANLVVEQRQPKKDPDSTYQDIFVWDAGALRVRRDFLVDPAGLTCGTTAGVHTADGGNIVEITLQSIIPLDPATLGETLTLQVYGIDGEWLGEVTTEWSSFTPAGPYQGAFIYQGVFELPAWASAATSVRIAPDADILAAALESPDAAVAETAAAARQLGQAHGTNQVALPGTDGDNGCGTLVSRSLDICSDALVSAMAGLTGIDPVGAGVRAVATAGPKDSATCTLATAAGDGDSAAVEQPVAAVTWTTELGNWLKLKQVAGILGCPVYELAGAEKRVLMTRCPAVTILFWLQALPGEGLAGPDGGEDGHVGTVWTAAVPNEWVPPALSAGPEDLGGPVDALPVPEDQEPILVEGVPLASVNDVLRAGDALTQESSIGLSVAPGENA